MGVALRRPLLCEFPTKKSGFGVSLRFRSNLLYQKFLRISTSVPRALKRHHAKRGASAEAEVRETLCTSPLMFFKRGEVQKCGTRAKFCEMLGVWGKVFRKNSLAYFLIFFGKLIFLNFCSQSFEPTIKK